jgi:two-component system LytT family response regulator
MSRPLSVLLVDDEPLARQRLRRLLRREPDVRVVEECADGPAAVATILREAPDIVLLDVQMPELDGFAVLRAVPPDRLPVVVFVTAFDRYALQAFEAQAVDYLLKPFTESRFRSAFDRARASAAGAGRTERGRLTTLLEQVRAAQEELREMAGGPERHAERLLVREEGRVVVVPVGQVDYLEAARNNVRVHSGMVTHLLREPLGALEQRLDPRRFARIHRSIVVNLDRVAEIQPWFSGDGIVVLEGGARLRLSRGFRETFERSLGRAARGRRV